MTGFDFAPATFAIGVASLMLIALNSRKIRQFSFTHTITSSSDQIIRKLPVGVTFGAINTCDNPIIPLCIGGSVLIGDNEIKLILASLPLEKGSKRYTYHNYKKI